MAGVFFFGGVGPLLLIRRCGGRESKIIWDWKKKESK
jgi:hypothetical protein